MNHLPTSEILIQQPIMQYCGIKQVIQYLLWIIHKYSVNSRSNEEALTINKN